MYNNNINRESNKAFHMSTEQIIETIERVRKIEVIDSNFNFEDVEVAIYNDDYYIRPGLPKKRFMEEWEKIALEAKTDGDKEYTYWVYIMKALNLIQQSFDEEYFREQIVRRRSSYSAADKNKLRTYLNKLDKDELKAFLRTVFICRGNYGLFVSEVRAVEFWKGIDDTCRKRGCDVPHSLDSAKGQQFLANNPGYYFTWLNKKDIATMLCRAIDMDVSLATSAAKKLSKCGCEAMIKHLNSKLSERMSA